MAKRLNVTGIVNELHGASAFFSNPERPLPPSSIAPDLDNKPKAEDFKPELERNPGTDLEEVRLQSGEGSSLLSGTNSDKSTNQQVDLSTSQQVNKSISQQGDKPTNGQVDKPTNQQINKPTVNSSLLQPDTSENSARKTARLSLKRFTTYLEGESIKAMKIIALEENRNDYEIFQEAVAYYLKNRK